MNWNMTKDWSLRVFLRNVTDVTGVSKFVLDNADYTWKAGALDISPA